MIGVLHFAHHRLEIDEFVARLHEQRMRDAARADTQRIAAILPQPRHKRSKITVARHNHKRLDHRPRDGRLERVERHANVGPVFARAHAVDLHQIQ